MPCFLKAPHGRRTAPYEGQKHAKFFLSASGASGASPRQCFLRASPTYTMVTTKIDTGTHQTFLLWAIIPT
ncbi:MAG: hypothetical protein F6K31_10515 [Symploca sp. SIO2G7]|nr:hypothetical protein [Symploca sp. SIO2G7]